MAMLNLTSLGPALHNIFPKGLEELLYKECPLMGWLPKSTDFGGDGIRLVPVTSGTMGSNDFDTALGNKTAPVLKKFVVTRVRSYAIASIDGETIMAADSNRASFARALETQTKAALYTFNRAMAHQLYSNSGGWRAIGDSSYTISGTTITLSDRRDIVNFEEGLVLQFSATDGLTGSVRPGSVTVTALDPDAGTVEVDAAISTAITGAANSDYIFRKGDFGNSIMGLRGWLPTTAPTSGDSHFGVDRSSNVVRLAGVRYNGSGKLLEETVIKAAARVRIQGGRPDTLFINSERFAELITSLHSKTVIDINTSVPGVGYKAVSFPTGSGTINIIDDFNCPYDNGFLLSRDSWEFASLGKCPHFAMDDGKKYSRESAADGVEFRVRGFHNLLCKRPGHNAVITW